MKTVYLFTTYFYDDGSTGYDYKQVRQGYKPKGIVTNGDCDVYEEIAVTRQELNDLIDELQEA